MRTNGHSRGQLFLKRWPLSNPNRTEILMNKHWANHHQNMIPKQIPITINVGKI